MNWSHQVKILNEYAQKFDSEINNFDKHTSIKELAKKFETISNNSFRNVKNDFTYWTQTNSTNMTSDAKIEIENQANIYAKVFANKKVRRKHLLNIIHPDKINYLIRDFEKETQDKAREKIFICTSKIISTNMSLMDSMELLYKHIAHINNSNVFKCICAKLKIDEEKTNIMIKYFDTKQIYQNQTNSTDFNFASLFSKEIIYFVNEFNRLNSYETPIRWIKEIFNTIYLSISTFVSTEIVNKLNDVIQTQIDLIRQNYLSKIGLNMSNVHDIKSDNSTLILLAQKLIESNEQLKELNDTLKMFLEDNNEYLYCINNINTITLGETIKILKNSHNTNTNISLFCEYFFELEKKLPILFQYMYAQKFNVSETNYIRFSISTNIDFEMIAMQEYERIKYNIV